MLVVLSGVIPYLESWLWRTGGDLPRQPRPWEGEAENGQPVREGKEEGEGGLGKWERFGDGWRWRGQLICIPIGGSVGQWPIELWVPVGQGMDPIVSSPFSF